jgi:hypothetical protein
VSPSGQKKTNSKRKQVGGKEVRKIIKKEKKNTKKRRDKGKRL